MTVTLRLIGKVGVYELDVVAAFDYDFAFHGAVLSQSLGQLAGVDVVDTHNLFFLQPVGQTLGGIPVAVFKRVVRYDQRFDVDFFRFVES